MSNNTLASTGNTLAASAVHSPGWPSPRAAEDGSMQPLFPGDSANYHGPPSASADPAIAMPPTPPEMLSRSTGSGGGGGWQPQARARGDAVGVAWLEVAETTGASTSQAGGAAAATATAAAGDSKREVVESKRTKHSTTHHQTTL